MHTKRNFRVTEKWINKQKNALSSWLSWYTMLCWISLHCLQCNYSWKRHISTVIVSTEWQTLPTLCLNKINLCYIFKWIVYNLWLQHSVFPIAENFSEYCKKKKSFSENLVSLEDLESNWSCTLRCFVWGSSAAQKILMLLLWTNGII